MFNEAVEARVKLDDGTSRPLAGIVQAVLLCGKVNSRSALPHASGGSVQADHGGFGLDAIQGACCGLSARLDALRQPGREKVIGVLDSYSANFLMLLIALAEDIEIALIELAPRLRLSVEREQRGGDDEYVLHW